MSRLAALSLLLTTLIAVALSWSCSAIAQSVSKPAATQESSNSEASLASEQKLDPAPAWPPSEHDCQRFWTREDYVNTVDLKSNAEKICQAQSKSLAELRSCLTQRYRKYQKDLQKRAMDQVTSKFKVEPLRRNCYKDWTILVAMDAENNLNEYSLWDLYEMEAPYKDGEGASTGRKDLIVQHDGIGEEGIRRIHMFQARGPEADSAALNHQILHERKKSFFEQRNIDDILSPVVDVLPEDDGKSKKQRFVEFVKWGMREYPARHYLVMVWGHGKGWVLEDPVNEVHLTGDELLDALKEIQEAPDGLNGKKKIDNFVADACFMQGLELSAALAPHVRFISGSAQVQTFLGLPYKTLMFEIERNFKARLKEELKLRPIGPSNPNMKVDHPEDDAPARLAQALPYLMKATLQPNGFQGRIDRDSPDSAPGLEFFTYSSVDTDLLQKDFHLFDQFASATQSFLQTHPQALASLQDRSRTGNTVFRAGVKARELGTHLQLLRSFAEPLSSKEAKELVISIDLLAGRLDSIVFSRYFAEKYGQMKGFISLGAWIPRKESEYDSDITQMQGNPFFSDLQNWAGMIRAQSRD